MDTDYDIIIIGAGMVGASLACALGDQPLRIGLIEAVPFTSDDPAHSPSYDARSTALSYGTRRIFEGMQLWKRLADQVTPIKKIHVSDQGHFGCTRLDAAEQGVEAFGYVVENRALGRLFAQALQTLSNVDLICPARVEALSVEGAAARVSVKFNEAETRTLSARLVVVAEGRKSAVREQLGIHASHWSYGQSAVIANITPAFAHANVAYERFTPGGPLALLPMSDKRCALVWTLRDEQLSSVMALSDTEFLRALQGHFGWRLGRLRQVGVRHAYPLALTRTHEIVRARLVLVGNAAHTLHPVAGQGFNLGLRDVAALAQVLVDGMRAAKDIGALEVLDAYAAWRRFDHRKVTALTDALVHIFSTDSAPLVAARNAGLVVTDVVPYLKGALVRQGMGITGRQPRLARGLAL